MRGGKLFDDYVDDRHATISNGGFASVEYDINPWAFQTTYALQFGSSPAVKQEGGYRHLNSGTSFNVKSCYLTVSCIGRLRVGQPRQPIVFTL